MKKLISFSLISCVCFTATAQFVYKIKADSVKITNDSCSAELILENSTKHVLGFLYNKGNGRTEFRTGSMIGDFILNQNSNDQSGSFRIAGSGLIKGGFSSSVGTDNERFGSGALTSITTGTRNTALGVNALSLNTSGWENTALGHSALLNNQTNYYSTAVGAHSLRNFIGTSAQYGNTAVGNQAMEGASENFTGLRNTALGQRTLIAITSGNDNTGLGFASLENITSGQYNTVMGASSGHKLTTGSSNTFIGGETGGTLGSSNLTGDENTGVGRRALAYIQGAATKNTAIGYYAGGNTTTGSGNVFLGYNAGLNETGSNKLYIANSNTSIPLIYGDFSNEIVKVNSKLVLGSLSANPTGENGMTYYNSFTGRFRGYANSSWQDIITSGNVGNGLVYYGDKIELGGIHSSPAVSPNGHLTRNTHIHTYDHAASVSRYFGIQTDVGPGAPGLTASFNQDGLVLGGQGNGFFFNTWDPSRTILKVGDFMTDGTRRQTGGFNSNGTGLEIYLREEGTNGNTFGQKINLEASNNVNLYGLTIRAVNDYAASPSSGLAGDNIALKLTSRLPNFAITNPPYKFTAYALYADSGRVYSRDSVMFGTTTPGAFFHVNGTSRFDLGSDQSGDIFYRNSSGLLTPLAIGANNYVLTSDGTKPTWQPASGGGGGGSGTVTSVGLSLPGEFSVSGSPVTTSGTLTGSWQSQTQNKIFASPNGNTGAPTFRSLVAADIPDLSSAYIKNNTSLQTSANANIDGYFRAATGFGVGKNPTSAGLDIQLSDSTFYGVKIRNTNADGYEAIDFFDHAGGSVMGMGYANSSAVHNPGMGYINMTNKAFSINYNAVPRITLYHPGGYIGINEPVPTSTFQVTGLNNLGNVTIKQAATSPGAALTINSNSGSNGDIFLVENAGTVKVTGTGGTGTTLTGRDANNFLTNISIGANLSLSGGVLSATGGGGGGGYSTIQENGTGLTQRSTVNFGYGVTAVDNSGSSKTDVDVDLSNSESFLTSDVALTANTYSDATSFSLGAGTWLITGNSTVESPNNSAQRVTYKLWNGTTVYQAGEASSNSMGANTKGYVSVPVSCIVVLTGTTTVKISIASTAASSIKATPGDNNSGTTNKATSFRAVRIK